MTTYVTFGQIHKHEIGDKIFDKDCVAVIGSDTHEEGRQKAFDLFGPKFCFEYFNEEWREDEARRIQYFPRGYIEAPDK